MSQPSSSCNAPYSFAKTSSPQERPHCICQPLPYRTPQSHQGQCFQAQPSLFPHSHSRRLPASMCTATVPSWRHSYYLFYLSQLLQASQSKEKGCCSPLQIPKLQSVSIHFYLVTFAQSVFIVSVDFNVQSRDGILSVHISYSLCTSQWACDNDYGDSLVEYPCWRVHTIVDCFDWFLYFILLTCALPLKTYSPPMASVIFAKALYTILVKGDDRKRVFFYNVQFFL